MPVIVKIGYTCFVVRKESDAAKVIQALAGAVELHEEFRGGRELFYPSDYPRGISMSVIRPEQILRHKPEHESDIEVDANPHALVRRVK